MLTYCPLFCHHFSNFLLWQILYVCVVMILFVALYLQQYISFPSKRQVGCLCARMDHLRRILLFTDVYSLLDLFSIKLRRPARLTNKYQRRPYLVLINRNIVRFPASRSNLLVGGYLYLFAIFECSFALVPESFRQQERDVLSLSCKTFYMETISSGVHFYVAGILSFDYG